jgi:hypothetical protein
MPIDKHCQNCNQMWGKGWLLDLELVSEALTKNSPAISNSVWTCTVVTKSPRATCNILETRPPGPSSPPTLECSIKELVALSTQLLHVSVYLKHPSRKTFKANRHPIGGRNNVAQIDGKWKGRKIQKWMEKAPSQLRADCEISWNSPLIIKV